MDAGANMGYILLTKFGSKEFDQIKKVSNENKLLKIQIEQKKLLNELAETK